jgi:hypothetical protein
MLLQFLFLGGRMTQALSRLNGAGVELAQELPAALVEVFFFSMGLLLPVIFGLGIVLTFRIAGPVHRFEQFLDAVARGEQIGPCKIRRGDYLQSLCEAINRATESTRRRTEVGTPESQEDETPARKSA